MKKLVLVFFCLFSTIRCAEIKSEDDNNNKGDTRVSALQLSDYVSIKVVPTSKPARYMVYFSWPKLEESYNVRIRLNEVLTVVGPNQTTFSHEVDHDQNLTYVFDILSDANKLQKSISKLVKVPLDLIFTKDNQVLTKDLVVSARRVFLSKDAPITTSGFKLDISVEELFSDEASIQTFPSGSKAEVGLIGKTPEDITIRAKSAVGKLSVVMRGQSGGDGADGAKFTSSAHGGAAAGAGESECGCDAHCHRTSNGGKCWCVKYGSNAGDGANGLPGIPGGNAMVGGNSGRLTISVQDGKEFEVTTKKEIGLAGTPGKGGDGQIGGAGGGVHKKTSCPGSAGQKGKDGEKAKDGLTASNGVESPICIYIANEEKNDCH